MCQFYTMTHFVETPRIPCADGNRPLKCETLHMKSAGPTDLNEICFSASVAHGWLERPPPSDNAASVGLVRRGCHHEAQMNWTRVSTGGGRVPILLVVASLDARASAS
jgi:hypothetical protein